MTERLRLILACLVGTGWLINLLAPIVVHTYSTNLAANAPLLLILGSLFQSGRKAKAAEK